MTERYLLLVDDDENIIRSLLRLFRQDHYKITTALSGEEGLEHLKNNQFGVIISDQRMPAMTGTEFLSKVKQYDPDPVRIVLSGYADFKSVSDAINDGEIYKFFNKPWDDDKLRKNIKEAFELYELAKQNKQLIAELQQVNQKLTSANEQLEKHLIVKKRHQNENLKILQFSHLMLESLPYGILAVDLNNNILFANELFHKILNSNEVLHGANISQHLSLELISLIQKNLQATEVVIDQVEIADAKYTAYFSQFDNANDSSGVMATFIKYV